MKEILWHLNLNTLPGFPIDPPLRIAMLVVVLWLGLIVLLAELLNRYTQAEPEVTRKVVHMGAGNVILLAWWFQIPAWIGIGASMVAGTIAVISYYTPILRSVNGVGRHSWGTFFYASSIGVLVAWFWTIQQPHYAVLGILIMVWGDGLAALVGQRFGQHRYQLWGMKKSWEGSLAMWLVSYGVSAAILVGVQGNIWQSWIVAAVVATVATGLEAFSKLGIDNLTVPVGSAATGFLITQFLSSLS